MLIVVLCLGQLVACKSDPAIDDGGLSDGGAADRGLTDASVADATPAPDASLADAAPTFAVAPGDLLKELEPTRYHADLVTIAKPRNPGTAHHAAIRALCLERFKKLGFATSEHNYGSGVNVIGVKQGGARAVERVVLSAHYDSVSNCDGADDNASGVSGLFEAARVLASRNFERTLVVACWDEEEAGLIGSQAYAEASKKQGDQIKAMFSLEMIGYTSTLKDSQQIPDGLELVFPDQVKRVRENGNRADFIALVFDTPMRQVGFDFQAAAQLVGLPTIRLELSDLLKLNPLAGDLQRSDHAAFWLHGFPGMMVTDTSNFRYDRYHCMSGADEVAQLDDAFTHKALAALVSSTINALGLVP